MTYMQEFMTLQKEFIGRKRVLMMYMEGVMTLQKGCMGQQDDVYDLPRRVDDTLEGAYVMINGWL